MKSFIPYGCVFTLLSLKLEAQSTWAVKYTDCISADRLDSPNKCPEYGTKQSDGEASVIQYYYTSQKRRGFMLLMDLNICLFLCYLMAYKPSQVI